MNFSGVIRVNRCGVCVLVALFVLILCYTFDLKSFMRSSKKLYPEKVSLKNLLIASIYAAESGGREVQLVKSHLDMQIESKGKTKEGADELLTIADKRSHCAMYYGLKQAFPNLKVMSEEETSEQECTKIEKSSIEKNSNAGHFDFILSSIQDEVLSPDDITIWIDPLDATQEFTENLLQYVTTMVCVAVRGHPVIGVIHKPFGVDPKTSWAWVNRTTSFTPKRKSEPYSFIVSRSHPGKVEKLAKEAFGADSKVISAGGSGYKVLEMVSGNVSTYIHTTFIKKWDICAPNAMILAAGGIMTSLKGNVIDYSASSNIAEKDGILLAWQSDYKKLFEKLYSYFGGE